MNSFNTISSNISKKNISPAYNNSLYELTGLSIQAYTGSYYSGNVNAFNGRTIITKVRNLQTIDTAFTGSGINTGSDNFNAQWTGYFKSDFTGTWNFYINSDDQTNFWIGDNAINYTITTPDIIVVDSSTSKNITLEKDRYYPIRIQYGEYVGPQYFNFGFTRNGVYINDSTNYLYSVKSGVPNLRGNPAVFI